MGGEFRGFQRGMRAACFLLIFGTTRQRCRKQEARNILPAATGIAMNPRAVAVRCHVSIGVFLQGEEQLLAQAQHDHDLAALHRMAERAGVLDRKLEPDNAFTCLLTMEVCQHRLLLVLLPSGFCMLLSGCG